MAGRKGGRGSVSSSLGEPRVAESISSYDGAVVRVIDEGSGRTTVEIDTSRLDPPRNAMTATYATAQQEEDEVWLVFGQGFPEAPKLQAVLVVQMTKAAVAKAVLKGNPDFGSNLSTYVQSTGHRPQARPYNLGLMPKKRVVFERASIVAISYTDEEADIRFWRVQPAELRKVSPQKMVSAIAPVVTIYLSTRELSNLVQRVEEMVSP